MNGAAGNRPPGPRGRPPRRRGPAPNRPPASRGDGGLARERALQVLLDFESAPFPLQGRLERDQAQLRDPEDRRLFRRLLGEVMRHRTRLDAWIDPLLTRGSVAALPAPIRGILRLGAVQIALFDRIPRHAAVDTSVEMAKRRGHRGTAGLVNAVLRRLLDRREAWEALGRAADDPAADPSALARAFSHPEWLVGQWMETWGLPATTDVLRWNQAEPETWIRRAPGTPIPPGATEGWVPGTARLREGPPQDWEPLAQGRVTIQDPSATLVGLLPEGLSGRILDLCAAPGTKTGHLLERASAEGPASGTWLLAADRSPGRLARLRRGLARGEAAGSAARPRRFVVAMDAIQPAVREGVWDGVLIDAPCSNLGVLRRRPDVRWRVTVEEIARLARDQRAMLQRGARLLAPGGWLVYSVCTFDPAETLEQRRAFLEGHPGFDPIDLPGFVPAEARRERGELLLLPGRFETDGGYAFVVQKMRAEA